MYKRQSDHAAKAVEVASDLASRYDATLTIIHAMARAGAWRVPEELRDFARMEHVDITENEILSGVAEEILNTAAVKAADHGAPSAKTVKEIGDPVRAVVDYAEGNGVDLIVLGRRGLGALQELLLGSVSTKITHLAKCTCITVC